MLRRSLGQVNSNGPRKKANVAGQRKPRHRPKPPMAPLPDSNSSSEASDDDDDDDTQDDTPLHKNQGKAHAQSPPNDNDNVSPKRRRPPIESSEPEDEHWQKPETDGKLQGKRKATREPASMGLNARRDKRRRAITSSQVARDSDRDDQSKTHDKSTIMKVDNEVSALIDNAHPNLNGHSRLDVIDWPMLAPTPETDHLFCAAQLIERNADDAFGFLDLLREHVFQTGRDVEIITIPVLFRDVAKRSWGRIRSISLRRYGVASSLKKPTLKAFTLGLLFVPPSIVAKTTTNWEAEPWHTLIVAVVHDPQRRPGAASPGKHYLICDPTIKIGDTQGPGGLMKTVLKQLKAKNVWINLPRPIRNDNGLALQSACKWLIELAERGLDTQLDEDGEIIGFRHFRKIST
ncbi:hypothetical protein MIND_00909600 [Mycena indigotica]|uniref:Uncharacterized protein n=1 Tax=Mycena indigotica TaxID=2126181 RepID=A0A8H6SDL3_9AGAR|nr:uncharacterized protein MIND_00909600 [Mycena indigotica]KAF7296786.1 hypothetical protein MIND_00909600 [Mycena indigotica]